MNMQKIMLEALSASDKKEIACASGRNLAKLISYAFPVDAKKVHSQKIIDRINSGMPVTFEWAADNWKNAASFLYDLGNSLVPQLRKNTSLFFSHQAPRQNLPLVSKMEEGPVIFDYFGEMMGRNLYDLAANTFNTTFDVKGNIETTKMDNDKGLITAAGPYYRNLEKELEYGKEIIENDSSLYTENSTKPEFEMSVLCGAYLRYMFNVFTDAKKQIDEATGDRVKKASFAKIFSDTHTLSDAYTALRHLTQMLDIKSGKTVENAAYTPEEIPESVDELRDQIAEIRNNIPKLEEYAGYASNVIARGAISAIPMDESGTLTNWGSILNQGENGEFRSFKVIDPTRITDGTLSEIKMYPRYSIDVLRVKDDIKDKLVSVLNNNGFGDIAEEIKTIGGSDDNRILPITIDRMKELLTDENFVTTCKNDEKLSSIFKKGGTSWVGATDADSLRASLDELLAGKPQMNNADIRNPRVVPVVVGKSLKSSNTSRERTGDGVVAQTYVDMDIADATAIKLSDGNTQIKYRTKDGANSHTVTLSPGWDGSRTQEVFKNVISRKSTEAGGGHEHFITIPFGIAFVAMQDEDGTIVRTENPDTLCMGLMRKGEPYRETSVQRLMNSPIGRYCNSVAKLGKVGRVRFSSAEANRAYTKILGALKRFKLHDQDFSCNPVTSMKGNLEQLDAVITFALTHETKKKLSQSEIESTIQSIKAPLLAGGFYMQVEVYNPTVGRFEFKLAKRMPFIMMSHLRDMYNLDKTDGYSKNAVLNVIAAVAPNVWDLSEWNYANVLRAENALNTSDEENAPVVDNADGMEDSDSVDYKGVDEVFDDNMNYQTANDGSTEEPTMAEYDVPSKDIGRDVTDALNSAINEAYDKAFGHSQTEPSTESDAARYQNALVKKFEQMTLNNELNLPGIAQAVAGIKYENFKDFVKKMYRVVNGMAANRPSDDDDSLRMGFFAESGKSTSWMVNVVKNVVADNLPENTSPEDAELIPEVGGLMAKFAFVNSAENGDMVHVFDRDYLTSTFEKTFNREFNELAERLDLLNQKVNDTAESIDASNQADLYNEFDVNVEQAKLYQNIKAKMENDQQFIAGVADIIVRNSNEIKNVLMDNNAQTDTISKGYVSFVPDTASTLDGPGMGIVDFCMYNMEANNEKQNINKLSRVFGTPVVASMMDDLVSSVPNDRIATDSIREEKSIEALDDNQRSLLMSYFKKANRYNSNFTNRIKALYTGATVEDYFAIEESMGDTSPYTYNGVQIDLRKVKPFFDTLMQIADSYNKIGTSASNQDGITHIQETVNNEDLDKHVLHNQYFMTLYSDFKNVYNRVVENQPFTKDDKRVMDRVVRDVLTNPMNVLINNNVKLITAYVYHKAIIDKTHNAQYQSTQSMGFGSGEHIDPSIRGNNLTPALRGVNRNYDMKTATLDLAYRITHSKSFVKETLPKAEAVVGNFDSAYADYQSYLDSINGDGDNARGLVEDVLRARPSGVKKPKAEDIVKAQAKKRDDILANMSVFCNYGIDDNTKATDAQRITDLRVNELIVLLYRTAYEIWEDIPQPTPGHIEGIVNANRDLLYSDILNRKNAVIPQELFERFRNLDAELQLADPEKHSSIYGSNTSNNDTAASAGNIMQERSRYSSNRTGDIVDMFITEKPLDDSVLVELFTSTFSKLSDSGVSLSCKCNVVDKNSNGTHIASNIILHPGEIIVFKENGVTKPASVINVIGNPDDKQYLITNVHGIEANDTDVEFVRFQLKNKFIGGDIQAKADDVFAQLNDWCDEYTAESVPDEVMFKALCLKYIFAGSGCAKIIKTIVSYYVWKLSGYVPELTPSYDISGDNPTGRYIGEFRRAIADDLRKFKGTDTSIYNKIYDFATKTRIMDSIRANTNLSSNEDTKHETKENETLINETALDTNVKNMFKHFVDYIVEKYGFVSQSIIDNTLPKVMSSKESADKLIDLANNSYKDAVASIIRNANMTIAEPLVEKYKSDCASSGVSPTVDGAIQYVKDNYAGPKTTDDNGNNINDELAEYLKKNCSPDIEWKLISK